MRTLALVVVLLAHSITQDEAPLQEDHSRCTTRCAAIPKDDVEHGMKACSCAASKGTSCDKDGNRTQEEMAGCVNRAHCLKGCCHCCPRD